MQCGSVLTALLLATSPNYAFLLQHLRSASTGLLQVPRARTTIDRRSFAFAGPSLWNSLPAALRAETRDDTARFQETTEGLFVPDLMCWQTEETFTTARRCCGVFVILAPDTNCILTYLLRRRARKSYWRGKNIHQIVLSLIHI